MCALQIASTTTITTEELDRLVGTPGCPVLIDGRIDDDFDADPRLIPGSIRRPGLTAPDWAADYEGRDVVVICDKGLKISQGAAAYLRHAGAKAWALSGGFQGWRAAGLPLIPEAALPARDATGRTHWVTRERPKIDRIACPWLIRRFIDPNAVILYVKAEEVSGVADRFGAAPFDIPNVHWSHRGDFCTFDTMLTVLGLETPVLNRLATIIRGADTARLDLAPEAAGLLAISLGFSQCHADDLQQLNASMGVYDALYRWARDASDESHNWPATPEAA